jgi:hypothetical protein
MYDARSLTLLVSSNHADHRRLVRAATRLLGPADAEQASPSAEMDAALAQEAIHALHLLATQPAATAPRTAAAAAGA